MKFCDFFSGIGGFRLGLERAGHKGVWACENDPFCRKIYAQHFEEPQGKDINDVKSNEIPEADLWCGGFPCQDNSYGGGIYRERKGLSGERSGLWWVWLALIRKSLPPWLLIENVEGLFSAGKRRDFGRLIQALDECGYVGTWRVLDARHWNIPQQRKRIFIVARLGKEAPAEVLFEREGDSRMPEKRQAPPIARCITARGAGALDDRETFIADEIGVRHMTVLEVERAMGFFDHWTYFVGASDSPRYKALGNAVAVPVIEWIGRRLPK